MSDGSDYVDYGDQARTEAGQLPATPIDPITVGALLKCIHADRVASVRLYEELAAEDMGQRVPHVSGWLEDRVELYVRTGMLTTARTTLEELTRLAKTLPPL